MAGESCAFKVLIAVDMSEHANNAFEWYVNHGHKENNEVILAHVSEKSLKPHDLYRTGIVISEQQWHMMREDMQGKLKSLDMKYGTILKSKNIKYHFKNEEGEPGHHLCKMAKEEGVNMIVLGTRGMGTVRRTILGSVSDYVLHHAHTAVVICRPHH